VTVTNILTYQGNLSNSCKLGNSIPAGGCVTRAKPSQFHRLQFPHI